MGCKGQIGGRMAEAWEGPCNAGWDVWALCLKAWDAARDISFRKMNWWQHRGWMGMERAGHYRMQMPSDWGYNIVVSKANSCWQRLKSAPFLFANDDIIITANYHPALPKFSKAKFGKCLFTSFSRFGVRGELEPPGVSVQDVTFCSPKPSASVPETYTQRKCLRNEVMCLGSSFISSSTSKERKRMCAFLRKSCGLEKYVGFGNKIKTLINLDFTNPNL